MQDSLSVPFSVFATHERKAGLETEEQRITYLMDLIATGNLRSAKNTLSEHQPRLSRSRKELFVKNWAETDSRPANASTESSS